MISQTKIDLYTLELFKIGIGIRIFCIFAKILLTRCNITDGLVTSIINYSSLIMLIITTFIITYKAFIMFHMYHKNNLKKHNYIQILIESIIFRILFFAILVSQKITSKFILHLNNLSLHAQQHQMLLLFILIMILIYRYAIRFFNIHKIKLDSKNIHRRIMNHIKKILFKIFILTAILIGAFQPAMQYLQPLYIDSFAYTTVENITKIVTTYIHSSFFWYAHFTILIAFIVWIIIDSHLVYTTYKQHKKHKGTHGLY